MTNFETALEKYGLSIMPRKRKAHLWSCYNRSGVVLGAYIEPEQEYNARFALAFKAHSLVMQYLEQHDIPFREVGYRYYDVLKMACIEYGEDYDELFAEYDQICETKQ